VQSATAASIADKALSATIELMARNLAETGMRRLFKIMLALTRQHASPNEMMRVSGEFVPVDPRSWNAGMDVSVNVGLGTDSPETKVAGLQQVLQVQQTLIQGMGPQNPLAGLAEVRQTVVDLLRLMGVHNGDEYLRPFTREQEMALQQQAAQQAAQSPSQPDPQTQAYLQVETMKAQSRAQADMAKLQIDAQAKAAEEQRKRAEVMGQQDIDRDKMVQDLALKVAELEGKLGIQINEQAIKAEQAANSPQG